MYRIIFFLALCVLGIIGYQYYTSQALAHLPTKEITIGRTPVTVEIAGTNISRSQGLSDREHLEKNHGMLFVFATPGFYEFWMKDMLFSIDMIWISKEHTIVSINKKVSPDSYPQLFSPTDLVQFVVEVPAGFSDANEIHIGDEVKGL